MRKSLLFILLITVLFSCNTPMPEHEIKKENNTVAYTETITTPTLTPIATITPTLFPTSLDKIYSTSRIEYYNNDLNVYELKVITHNNIYNRDILVLIFEDYNFDNEFTNDEIKSKYQEDNILVNSEYVKSYREEWLRKDGILKPIKKSIFTYYNDGKMKSLTYYTNPDLDLDLDLLYIQYFYYDTNDNQYIDTFYN